MRRIKKTYKRPLRPWDADRIEAQKKVMREYGLRRNREILRAESILRNYRQRARKLISSRNEAEIKTLLDKLVKYGLIKQGQHLDDVLALSAKDILERRLQTIVMRKGKATKPLEARQLIVHGHVTVGGRRTNIPSYMVPAGEESSIVIEKKEIHKAKAQPAPEALAEAPKEEVKGE